MVKGHSSTIDTAIGARLSALRKQRGVSQAALGRTVSISYQQLQKYERGRNRISVRALTLFAQALDVPVQYFFEDVQIPAATGHGGRPSVRAAQTSELVAAFEAIASTARRRRVLELVKALARRD